MATIILALLFKPGDTEDADRLLQCLQTIQEDSTLKDMIWIFPMDSPKSRNWAKHNTSGVKITQYPVFVVKIGSNPLKVYSLGDAEKVYQIARSRSSTNTVDNQQDQTSSSNPIHVIMAPGNNPVLDNIIMAKDGDGSGNSFCTKCKSPMPIPTNTIASLGNDESSSGSSSTPSSTSSSDESRKHHHHRHRKGETVVTGISFNQPEKGGDDIESAQEKLVRLTNQLQEAI